MPRLVVGYTEHSGSKLKIGKGFLQPNFWVGPNWTLKRVKVYAFSTELRGQMDWVDWLEGGKWSRAGT